MNEPASDAKTKELQKQTNFISLVNHSNYKTKEKITGDSLLSKVAHNGKGFVAAR